MIEGLLANVKEKAPLVHSITNYVTVNDCANALLAVGASPIMADCPQEAAQITKISDALYINIGTPGSESVSAMKKSGAAAKEKKIPVLLDPVGIGASDLRTKTAKEIVSEIKPQIIKGNISEIKTLLNGCGRTNGVEARKEDCGSEDETVEIAKNLAKKTGAVIIITGVYDTVSDGAHTYIIRNGHKLMSRITGAGCMLGAFTSAFAGANPEMLFEASAAAVMSFGICGEIAAGNMLAGEGSASFKTRLIDAIYNLDEKILKEGQKYEMR